MMILKAKKVTITMLFTIAFVAFLFILFIIHSDSKPIPVIYMVKPVDTSILDRKIMSAFRRHESAVKRQVTMICSGGFGSDPYDVFDEKCKEFEKEIDNLQNERLELVGEKFPLDFSNLGGW